MQVKCTVHFPGESQGLQPKSIPKQDLCCWVGKSICRKLVFRSQLLHSHIPHERRWILCTIAIRRSSRLVCKAAEFSLPPQDSSRKLFCYSKRRLFLWLTWPIFQHQLSTVIHCFGACQDFYLSRLQHVYDPVAGWSHIWKWDAVLHSLSICKFRNQAKTTTVVKTQLVIYCSICTHRQKLSHIKIAWRQCIVSLRFTPWFSATVGDSIIYKNLSLFPYTFLTCSWWMMQ